MPVIRLHRALSDIHASDWDALHDGRNPFVAHAFLSGLETTGCLREDWGWTPCHLGLWQGDLLVAAAPGYLKSNSHGEFVFDHAWAHAYARHGLDYFPKWLGAVPYSPVTGPRLLARDEASKRALLDAIGGFLEQSGLSSAHVNFHDATDEKAFDATWLLREDIQYHWHNTAGWTTFEDFLAAMDHKHRKNIRQERARVARAGVEFRRLHGDEAGPAELDLIHHFYLQTFREYGNAPALTREFISHIAREMSRNIMIVIAYHAGKAVAGALFLRGRDTLYGRYWGSDAVLPGLHFETCYYQGIEYCLREGLQRFEPGAQGEHKLARGFLPTEVRSHHWLAHPQFREAVHDWCERERKDVAAYMTDLLRHSPFKQEDPSQ